MFKINNNKYENIDIFHNNNNNNNNFVILIHCF
jgi:hypothetical protein